MLRGEGLSYRLTMMGYLAGSLRSDFCDLLSLLGDSSASSSISSSYFRFDSSNSEF